jgi:hypothetical protein
VDLKHLTRGVGLSALCIASFPGAAHGSTLPAACSDGTGDPASLVSAIAGANALTGEDTVDLGAGCTYNLTTPDNYWYGPNGLPPIASDITVEGHGATIHRPPGLVFRFFFVGADPLRAETDNYVSPGARERSMLSRIRSPSSSTSSGSGIPSLSPSPGG